MTLATEFEALLLADGAAEARRIGAELGLRASQERWEGLGLVWAFTCEAPGAAQGATFYVPAGARAEVIERRWREKREEFEGGNRGTREIRRNGRVYPEPRPEPLVLH